MEKFECWLVDTGDRNDRTDVDAYDEGTAAEEFIQALEDNGYFSGGFGESRSVDVGVIDKRGIETCWSVSGYFVTTFVANEKKPIGSPLEDTVDVAISDARRNEPSIPFDDYSPGRSPSTK